MYDFHNNYILKKYSNDSCRLHFTDTDSLLHTIKTDDVYSDFMKEREKFDNYPADNPFAFKENKKVIGKMKDECAGVPIVEFVGLRSKMYSYLKESGGGGKTAKGIRKNIKKVIMHEDYKSVLLEQKQLRHTMKTIRSVKHQLSSYEINKVSLSCFEDKRYILDNGIDSYAYGHKNIVNNNNTSTDTS